MGRHILFVHYTPPGVVGGVELIMHEHAALLRARGYEVEVAAGRMGETATDVRVIPELDATRPESSRVEAELDAGIVSPRFHAERRAIAAHLAPLLQWADAVVAHNALTLHFNLALTSVLWDFAWRRPGALVAWCHDLAWTNPLYLPLLHPGYPWDLLRRPAPGATYITVSQERAEELAGLWEGRQKQITVVPNGIDPGEFLRLSPETRALAQRYRLFERDAVLLLPVRITRRKNIQAGIRAVRNLKDRGVDVLFLISGPQAPHHPGRSNAYLDSLKALRAELELEHEVVFLADELGRTLDVETVWELYLVADVLLLPSAQEGFGLPIIEAGLARVPVVLSDIPIFHEVGGNEVSRFELDASADTIAETIQEALTSKPARLYRRVLREYRWDAILDRLIIPLLGGSEGAIEAAATGKEREQ